MLAPPRRACAGIIISRVVPRRRRRWRRLIVWRGCEYGLQFGGEAGRGPGKRAYVTSRDGNIRAGLIRRGTSPRMLERERNPCARLGSAALRSARRVVAATPGASETNRENRAERARIDGIISSRANTKSRAASSIPPVGSKYAGEYKPRRA
jgi:hypothetical protein